ncbi:hypothetical protein Hanom_Chr06g00493251 [Helianthus anomalus]
MVQSFWILLFYFGLDSLVLYSVRCHLDCSNVIFSLFKRFEKMQRPECIRECDCVVSVQNTVSVRRMTRSVTGRLANKRKQNDKETER